MGNLVSLACVIVMLLLFIFIEIAVIANKINSFIEKEVLKNLKEKDDEI